MRTTINKFSNKYTIEKPITITGINQMIYLFFLSLDATKCIANRNFHVKIEHTQNTENANGNGTKKKSRKRLFVLIRCGNS